MSRLRNTMILLTLMTASVALAQDPPSREELAAITSRGTYIAEYDRAAWHGTDAVQALHPDEALVGNYIARREDGGKWRVVFGKRSQNDDAFMIAYEALEGDSPTDFIGKVRQPPIADSGWFLLASRSLDTVRSEFHPEARRPYNLALLPSQPEGWFVYAYPAVVTPGVWPIGGDTRYTLSADGRAITATRQLHKTILETGPPKDKDVELKAGFHTHVLSCIPEDTDVMAVLSRSPNIPEYITCDPFMYRVEANGTIQVLGLTKDILNSKNKEGE